MAASGIQRLLDRVVFSCSLLCGIDQTARMKDAAEVEFSVCRARSRLRRARSDDVPREDDRKKD
jgi:hypothetical protein